MPQNFAEAARWGRMGADQGEAWAQGMLGILYGSGWGVPQEYVTAHMWLHLAASPSTGEGRKQAPEEPGCGRPVDDPKGPGQGPEPGSGVESAVPEGGDSMKGRKMRLLILILSVAVLSCSGSDKSVTPAPAAKRSSSGLVMSSTVRSIDNQGEAQRAYFDSLTEAGITNRDSAVIKRRASIRDSLASLPEDRPPRFRHIVEPAYPEEAISQGLEGTVSILILVGEDGNVKEVGTFTGDEIFHDSVKAAVLRMTFAPAIMDGAPVKFWVSVKFQFTIPESPTPPADDSLSWCWENEQSILDFTDGDNTVSICKDNNRYHHLIFGLYPGFSKDIL